MENIENTINEVAEEIVEENVVTADVTKKAIVDPKILVGAVVAGLTITLLPKAVKKATEVAAKGAEKAKGFVKNRKEAKQKADDDDYVVIDPEDVNE